MGTQAASHLLRSEAHCLRKWSNLGIQISITNMNDKKQGYMEQVDSWSLEAVIRPLFAAWRHCQNLVNGVTPEEREKVLLQAVEDAQKAIRGKLLESYRNGQKACPKCNPKPGRIGKPEAAGSGLKGVTDLLA
jgi:hypothetical protein